jgi:phage/conjugal plasmid C-4 type zinc finger TraR family protein
MGDWLDEARDVSERERQALITRARRRDDGIALDGAAFDDKCVDCGDEIPIERIAAKPGCTRCLSCQEKHERRRRA